MVWSQNSCLASNCFVFYHCSRILLWQSISLRTSIIMKQPKYYLVTLEWSHGFTSHSVIMGNRLEGEKQHIASLTYVKNSTFTEIEQHEYSGFWTGEFKPQGISKVSERTSTDPKPIEKQSKKPKGPQFSSLETFFNNAEQPKGKPNGRHRKTT
jgi:hypothetical protein